MGSVIVAVFAVYLVLAAVVIAIAATAAKRRDRNPWVWGTAAGLVVYLLVFWDHIPTVLVHKYYCATEGGFWIGKTMDQWRTENPGVAESLVPVKGAPSTRHGDSNSYTDTYVLNERFVWKVKKQGPHFLNRWRHEHEVVDAKTSEALARYVDFSTGYGLLGVQQGKDWRIVKFWLQRAHCAEGAINRAKMGQFMGQARDPEGRTVK